MQIYQPWRVHEYGYMSSVVAHLQHVEVSTSLQFRQLLDVDNLKVTFVLNANPVGLMCKL